MGDDHKTTEINSALRGKDTVINSDIQLDNPNFTVVNPKVQNYTVDISAGTAIVGKYVVEYPLCTNTGEANLYLCTYHNRSYVAKVYRRQKAIKDDIILALETVNSPYVATLYETGTWNGAPFEIIPFYKYGSLEGKTIPFLQLRTSIIPALNTGLHELHQKSIIHKDLKPSNIMICDDQKSVAIIDFGISSIREGGNTVVVTNTGMTPEYSAPETFRNLFLEESDYYSLGITIYELYTGHTPYSGFSKDVIEQYIAVQKIPFPKDFPTELEKLITGLTYNDITNRKDKSNPNRRWTYEEVKLWCAGEDVPVPGGRITSESDVSEKIPPFTFQYKKYTNVADLADALGEDWKNGKRRLYRSLLTQYFTSVNQEVASHCMDAEEAVRRNVAREDVEFFCLLYKMYPHLKSFHWVEYHFKNMHELGTTILDGLRKNNQATVSMVDVFIQNRLFSQREEIVGFNNRSRSIQVATIESKYIIAKRSSDRNTMLQQMFLVGYLYSESKELVTGKDTFDSFQGLTAYIKTILANDKKIDMLSSELIAKTQAGGKVPAPQFAAWLFSLGFGDII